MPGYKTRSIASDLFVSTNCWNGGFDRNYPEDAYTYDDIYVKSVKKMIDELTYSRRIFQR